MVKEQKYLGMEVKKKGNKLHVDCALLINAYSRKQALEQFRKYADFNPGIVLTERESQTMLDKLLSLLRPRKLTKKEVKAILQKRVSEKEASAFVKELNKTPEIPATFKARDKTMIPNLIEKLGLVVFGDKEKFIRWMHCPCKALDNKAPANVLKTKAGIKMILDELGRIENRVFA